MWPSTSTSTELKVGERVFNIRYGDPLVKSSQEGGELMALQIVECQSPSPSRAALGREMSENSSSCRSSRDRIIVRLNKIKTNSYQNCGEKNGWSGTEIPPPSGGESWSKPPGKSFIPTGKKELRNSNLPPFGDGKQKMRECL